MMKHRPLIIWTSIIVGSLLGILFSSWLVPPLFKKLPSDFKRTQFLIETLGDPSHKPEILLFGNSILMNGIDARLLSERMDGQRIYNMSSPGQNWSEGVLLYQEIPPSVHTVVQFLHYHEFEYLRPLMPRVFRDFRLYGYQPNPETYEILGDSAMEFFSKSELTIRFEAREVLFNFVNNQLRKALRKDLELSGLTEELYFPNPYTQKMNADVMEKLIQKANPPKPLVIIEPEEAGKEVLGRAVSYFQEKNIRYVLVIYPLNPAMTNYTPELKQSIGDTMHAWSQHYTEIYNFVDSLEADDFVDHWHPYKNGAEKWTRALANVLAQ